MRKRLVKKLPSTKKEEPLESKDTKPNSYSYTKRFFETEAERNERLNRARVYRARYNDKKKRLQDYLLKHHDSCDSKKWFTNPDIKLVISVHGAWMKVPVDIKRKLNRLAEMKNKRLKEMKRLILSSRSWGPPVKLGAGRTSQQVQNGRPSVWIFPDGTRVIMVDGKLRKIITWNDSQSQ